jgi:hypothetical protein
MQLEANAARIMRLLAAASLKSSMMISEIAFA